MSLDLPFLLHSDSCLYWPTLVKKIKVCATLHIFTHIFTSIFPLSLFNIVIKKQMRETEIRLFLCFRQIPNNWKVVGKLTRKAMPLHYGAISIHRAVWKDGSRGNVRCEACGKIEHATIWKEN